MVVNTTSPLRIGGVFHSPEGHKVEIIDLTPTTVVFSINEIPQIPILISYFQQWLNLS
jgi:hypothetical protein